MQIPEETDGQSVFEIRVRGLVQGVGFRPFVWQLASRKGLAGEVLNDAQGVLIRISGRLAEIDDFVTLLRNRMPPLARVDAVEIVQSDDPPFEGGFRIGKSREGSVSTGIVPDAATCPDCLADTLNPSDRRSGYAFTNCTHCGPRFSIIRGIPYDREKTSMRAFTMCHSCQKEYETPSDRRFHAQPNACPDCGPQIWLERQGCRMSHRDPIACLAEKIACGQIAAIKGIGGFHLAVDAENRIAIAELRRRKNRPDKPFAVMACDLDQIRRYCLIDEQEKTLLQDRGAPIVLLRRREGTLPEGLAPGLDRLGFMLPYTPLHHMLLRALGRPIVLTSGNRSSDPQVTSNEEARHYLEAIADVMLMHNRDIVNRLDDSVICNHAGHPAYLRRARGFAPETVWFPPSFAGTGKVLAMGGELKSTFCMLGDRKAVVSQHIGDLENAPTLNDYFKMIGLYRDLYDFEPDVIAIDLHESYFSAQEGRCIAADSGIPFVTVQHHHAHLASVLVDNSYPPEDGDVLGIILDGTGRGTDDTNWGGEFLVGGYRSVERVASLLPVSLPGGSAAVREPWRNLLAHLHSAFGPDYPDLLSGLGIERHLREKPLAQLNRMIEQRVNSPLSSSAGRLFDAVAALLGICFDHQSYEGQAGSLLEAAARQKIDTASAYPMNTVRNGDVMHLDCRGLWLGLLDDLRKGVETGQLAANAHATLVRGVADCAFAMSSEHNITTAALSGGVFQNEILLSGLGLALHKKGMNVLHHITFPANDGGLALGQAAIAAIQDKKI